jgi:pteridine reductase
MMLKQKQGKIINIADVAAGQGWMNYIPYSVSKAGVIALTKGMAKALAPHVAVNVIVPGIVLPAEGFDQNQEQRLKRKIPLNRFGSPEDVAKAVVFLIESGDYMTGAEIKIDGGRTLCKL